MQMKEAIRSQYAASLAMLKDAIERCPDSLWQAEINQNAFWRVAYHTLFYTHLYLQPDHSDFVTWSGQRPGTDSFGRQEEGSETGSDAEPYSRQEVLAYHTFCLAEVGRQAPALDLDAPSGFHWLSFSKLEVQFYNIRHIQHHTGELCERLGVEEGIEVGWVGKA